MIHLHLPLAFCLATASLLATIGVRPALASSISACKGGFVELRNGNDLDFGSAGRLHNDDLTSLSFAFQVLKRCSDDQTPCEVDADCGNQQCSATCDCNIDPTCEVTGPVGTKRCLANFAACSSNADCPSSGACIALSGPPIPLATNGTPLCAISQFETDLSGTVNVQTGDATLSTSLRWRLFLGIDLARPCPSCGAPEQNPKIGDQFTCSGGPANGNACTVDAVTEEFGGVSYDCAPAPGFNVSGNGQVVRLNELTTGVTTKTAKLPCGALTFRSNPLNAPTNPGKCLDTQTTCTSNADCRRCSADTSTACTSDGDCSGKGSCAEAPLQPISCGFWCPCGFCNGTATLPCTDSSECPQGQVCQAGSGSTSTNGSAQQQPNNCSNDSFRCGTQTAEECATTKEPYCSGRPGQSCTVGGNDCEQAGLGTCIDAPRPCFESRITRSGTASPIGRYCAFAANACASDVDCSGDGDFCADDAMAPRLAAVGCSAASTSGSINTLAGITGPVAADLQALVKICRCHGPDPLCDAFCSDLTSCAVLPGGSPCSDGNPCTVGETCSAGACTGGTALVCDDGVACNGSETCEPASGCVAGTPTCNDGNPCTNDVCDEDLDECQYPGNDAACDDGLFCNGSDTCSGGGCTLHSGTPCPGADGDADCSETCSESSDDCSGNDTDGSACNDGNSGTTGETCESGQCVVDTPAPICGDANENGAVQTSDALRALQKAVGQSVSCPPYVCDTNNNGSVQSGDALVILKKAVGQNVTLTCPPKP